MSEFSDKGFQPKSPPDVDSGGASASGDEKANSYGVGGDFQNDEGEQSWKNLLRLDAEVFKQRNIRMLTPEARLLIHLKLSGTLTVTQAMEMAGVSYRGFYAVLERLKRAGLVGQVKDRTDQRVRNLRLEPSTPIPPAGL